jgi:hypothetical protein
VIVALLLGTYERDEVVKLPALVMVAEEVEFMDEVVVLFPTLVGRITDVDGTVEVVLVEVVLLGADVFELGGPHGPVSTYAPLVPPRGAIAIQSDLFTKIGQVDHLSLRNHNIL